MRYGKLSSEELYSSVLKKIKSRRSEVKLSATLGEDCAALKFDGYMLLSCDPITAKLPLRELGSLTVNVCANDIVSNGGEPVAMMMTVIMPTDACAQDVGVIMEGAESTAKDLNMEIVGGHTEFSPAVNYPVTCGTAIGKADRLYGKDAIKDGEEIVVTKEIGIEGTVILSLDGGLDISEDEQSQIESYKKQLSVVKDGLACRKISGISSMHDVTEGGILGAVAEICESAGVGAEIYEENLPVSALTRKVCKANHADPYRLISSGSLLITCKDADFVTDCLEKEGIKATRIGKIIGGKVYFVRTDGRSEQVRVQPDELFRVTGNNKIKGTEGKL